MCIHFATKHIFIFAKFSKSSPVDSNKFVSVSTEIYSYVCEINVKGFRKMSVRSRAPNCYDSINQNAGSNSIIIYIVFQPTNISEVIGMNNCETAIKIIQ